MAFVDLGNRLKKRYVHLKKWARREGVTCFRVYDRDLPDYPLILDWIDGCVVVWLFDRVRDDTETLRQTFQQNVCEIIQSTFEIPLEVIHIKKRGRSRGVETQYTKSASLQRTKVVEEYGLRFELNLSDYLDIGLFLDHRKTRRFIREISQGKRVLNLFGYTGAFTCYAIDGGALSTTTVDLSRTYMQWAKRNLELNRFLGRKADRFIIDNGFPFIKKEAAYHRYDIIICDPPTFSNSKKMKRPFSIDSDHVELIRDCMKLLGSDGSLFFSTNSRTFTLDEGLSERYSFEELTKKTCSEDFDGKKGHRVWRAGKR